MSEIITVDGTGASGKSTVGFLFAKKIGYQFIDSGSIYRIGSLLAKRNNIDIHNDQKCAELFKDVDIKFEMEDDGVKVLLNSEDVTSQLNTPEIDKIVPVVAAHKLVRDATKRIQKEAGLAQDTVMAGRDIGAEIFPESDLKFFITASVIARANRRYNQHVKTNPSIKYEDIEQEIKDRDEKDATREASPMRIPENAIVIDTSDKNIDEVINILMDHYTEKKNQIDNFPASTI